MLRAGAIVILAVGMIGCRPGPPRRPLADADPIFLIPAIKQAAAKDRSEEVPRLIELLDSEDAAVRLYASMALREMTGQTLGYTSYAPIEQREEAVERWRQWSVEQGYLP